MYEGSSNLTNRIVESEKDTQTNKTYTWFKEYTEVREITYDINKIK